jgi:hypothetical protein
MHRSIVATLAGPFFGNGRPIAADGSASQTWEFYQVAARVSVFGRRLRDACALGARQPHSYSAVKRIGHRSRPRARAWDSSSEYRQQLDQHVAVVPILSTLQFSVVAAPTGERPAVQGDKRVESRGPADRCAPPDAAVSHPAAGDGF